ncbi:hypothetical protein [Endozoicomonas sp. SESOKO4]|uniref:hypothetical protein n=1 Tax=Endozoicomonas sp. SESOKO4 TaxID=2828745 RepID=UPI0021486F44|nr:hypothetical protein [Endozoicomonas sp. SESOKO4]
MIKLDRKSESFVPFSSKIFTSAGVNKGVAANNVEQGQAIIMRPREAKNSCLALPRWKNIDDPVVSGN